MSCKCVARSLKIRKTRNGLQQRFSDGGGEIRRHAHTESSNEMMMSRACWQRGHNQWIVTISSSNKDRTQKTIFTEGLADNLSKTRLRDGRSLPT